MLKSILDNLLANLTPKPLTQESFAPFGDVIEVNDHAETRDINEGHTVRYHNLAKLNLGANGGEPGVNIFRSTPLKMPLQLRFMERHPLSSQAFMPLSGHPYLVVVAPPGDLIEADITVFLAEPYQGVNYQAGTWHHYCLALGDVSDFLVVDRIGDDENCDEVDLTETLTINL